MRMFCSAIIIPAGACLCQSQRCGQTPVYYSRSYISKNRNYLLMDSQPLYPFGFGLSYTTFAYSDLQASFQGEELVVSFTVTNTGQREGREVLAV